MPEEIHELRRKFLQAYMYTLITHSYNREQQKQETPSANPPAKTQAMESAKKITDEPMIPSIMHAEKSRTPMQQFQQNSMPQHAIQNSSSQSAIQQNSEQQRAIQNSAQQRATQNSMPQHAIQNSTPQRAISQNQISQRSILQKPFSPPAQPQIKKVPAILPTLPPVAPSQSNGKSKPLKLGKIAKILIDPTVLSVESPGPQKNLVVNRGGQIQTSPENLTQEEIKEIMKSISERTRIPLTPGLFKAAVEDLLVTAVVSDYVGTRFIIQKRLPFQ